MNQKPNKKRRLEIAAAISTVAILAVFIIGIAGIPTVTFNDPQVSHADAASAISQLTISDLKSDHIARPLILFPPLAIVLYLFFVFTSAPWRWLGIAAAVLLPLLFLDPGRAIAQFLYLPFIALALTPGLIQGSLDGEDWSEGFVTWVAMGWWLLMWLGITAACFTKRNAASEEAAGGRD